jgi:hypothetical protein
MDPIVEGGMRIIIHIEGGKSFNLDVSLAVLKQYGDSLLDEASLLTMFQYSMTEESAQF